MDVQQETYELVKKLNDKVDGLVERVVRVEIILEGKEKAEEALNSRIVSLETKVTQLEYFKWKMFGALSVVTIIASAAMSKLINLLN